MEIKLTDKKIINISPANARELILTCQNLSPTEVREQYQDFGTTFLTNKITELKFYNKKSFKLGEKLKINNIYYTINYIEQNQDYSYSLIDSKFNKSTLFLLPLIAEDNKYAGNYLTNYCLYNTYLTYPGYAKGNYLFLCYKFIDNEAYKKLETEIMVQKNFIEVIENGCFTIFVMELDKKYHYIVEQFINGEYHKFHSDVKNKIISFYDIRNNANIEAYIPIFNKVTEALSNAKSARDRVEKNLRINLPTDMNWLSKPSLINEKFKL